MTAIAWQVAITFAITLSAYFLGAGIYMLYVIFVIFAMIGLIVIQLSYLKTRDTVISRGLGITLTEFRYAKALKRQHKELEASRYLKEILVNNEIKREQETKEFKKEVELITQLQALIKEKNLSLAQVQIIAKKHKLPEVELDMTASELEKMIKAIKDSGVAGI